MTLSSTEVTDSLELLEIKPGKKVRLAVLRDLLPDVETALFFGKAYSLDYVQLSQLLSQLFNTTVVQALLNGGDQHSTELQDYIIDVVPDAELIDNGITTAAFTNPTAHEFLPELWEQLDIEIATSIKELVDTLDGTLSTVAGKYGHMLFSTLATLNKQRQGVIGAYKAQIQHAHHAKNLVVFDVSGSVSRTTAQEIVDEVVALAYRANASLAIVSNTTAVWDPGSFTSDDVMSRAEFGGTQYETLASLFQEDWSTVVTIADYDSAWTARDYLANHCSGQIQQVLDISLVNRPTFLAECLGQLAHSVRPLLVGNSEDVLGGRRHRW